MSRALEPNRQILGQEVTTLEDGGAVTLDCRGMVSLRIKPDGGTISLSWVDSDVATAHSTDTLADVTAEAEIAIDWPFMRVSCVGGTCRMALIS